MKNRQDSGLLHEDVTRRILKVFFDVYHELGFGFREFVYHRAMRIALVAEGLRLQHEVEWPVWFRGECIAKFQPDLVVMDGPVLLELKAKSIIEQHDIAQALSYLKASDIEVALVLNFGKRADFVRRILENGKKASHLAEGPTEIFPQADR